MARGRGPRLMAAAAILGALAWFVVAAIRDGGALDLAALTRHPQAVAAATAGTGAAVLLFAWAWAIFVRAAVPASPLRPLLSVFLAAWLTRYIPGKVPALGVRIYLGRSIGYPLRPLSIATGAQLLLDVLVSAIAGVTLVAAGLLIAGGASGAGVALVAIAVAVAAVVAWSLPRAAAAQPHRLLNPVLTRMRQPALAAAELPPRGRWLAAALLTLAGAVANGLALFALLAVFSDARPPDLVLVTGAVALAGVAGIVVAIAPSGLGVREGVLVALLGPQFSPDVVLFAALLLRVLSVAADVALALAGGGHLLARSVRAARRGETGAPALGALGALSAPGTRLGEPPDNGHASSVVPVVATGVRVSRPPLETPTDRGATR